MIEIKFLERGNNKIKTKCDFCQKKGEWRNVLKDSNLQTKDGSELVLCDDCMTHYARDCYANIMLK